MPRAIAFRAASEEVRSGAEPPGFRAFLSASDLLPQMPAFATYFRLPVPAQRPMSENTVNAALRRLGYATTDVTGHGFRSMVSTLFNEPGWQRDTIERQLAHGERNEIRAAYNYADYLPERRPMMQSWADHLDELRQGGNVVSLSVA